MKKNIIILVGFCLFLSIVFMCNIVFSRNKLISNTECYNDIEKIFNRDKAKLSYIKEYFMQSNYIEIYVAYSMNPGMIMGDGKNIKNDDLQISQTIEELKSNGYEVIGKDKNSIYFQRYSNKSNSKGIAYSIDRKALKLRYIINQQPLSEDGWFIYETDYNTWKISNVTNGIPNYLLGKWNIQYAKTRDTAVPGEEYPLDKLYNIEELDYGVTITLNDDSTFSRTVGNPSLEGSTTKGTYMLRYDNKVLLKHQDGTQSTLRYIEETGEIIYYTFDVNLNAVDEYYSRERAIWGRTFFGNI